MTADPAQLDALLGEGAAHEALQAVLDLVGDGVVACDATGALRYCNRTARTIYGAAEHLAVQHLAAEHLAVQHLAADGVTPLRDDEHPLARTLREGTLEGAEAVIVPRDGARRRVMARGRAVRAPGGETLGAVVVMREIPEPAANSRDAERARLAQLAALLSSVSEGVIVADASGHVIEWNAAGLAMHELDDASDARRHLVDFERTFELRTLDGELIPRDAWPLARALRGETFSHVEMRLRRLDRGWEKVIAYAGTALRDERGEIVLALLTTHDTTERRRADALLEQSRRHTEMVVEGANVGVWYCPLPFDRLVWDAKVKEHFHLPADAEVTMETFYERLHPEDREATRRAIEASIERRERYDIEYRTVSPDGARVRWIRAIGRALYDDVHGAPVRFDGISMDVTDEKRAEIELRDSERRFREMADAAPAMLWVTEPDGECSFLSRGWCEFTGQSVEEGLGYGWVSAAHPDDQPAAAAAFRDANERRVPYEIDFRLRRADGVYRWVIDAGLPRFGPGGELLGFVGSVIDVHERKRAEALSRESEARLRLAIAIAELGTFEIDLATDTVHVNETGRAIYGWPAGAPLTFAQVQTHFHPDDAPAVLARVEDALRPDGPGEFDLEQRIVRTDGATRWIRVRGRALFEGSGEARRAVRCAGTYLDVTDRREAAEREALHRQLVETVIRHLPAGVAIVSGNDLRLRLANPVYQALAGGAVLGRAVDEVWPEASPVFGERCRRVLETGEPYTAIDERYEMRDARTGELRERFFSWSVHRVLLPGEDEHGLLATIWETTERKAAERSVRDSEERFRQLANSIPQLAWISRPDGWVFWFNDRWYEYTGTTPEQMEGWGWQSVHDPAVLPDVVALWRSSIVTGQPFEMTFPMLGADGRYRTFLTRGAPLRDASGKIALWFGTHTDISEKERLLLERQALLASEQAARERAEEESRLKDEFLATLSHELRTPLNAILGWAQLLGRGIGGGGDDDRRALQVIERNARAQAQLIDDLLDMNRIISGKIRLDVQRVSLPEVIDAAYQTVRPAAEAKGVRLSEQIDRSAAVISGDPGRLQQVVWNLLHNAVKFTPRGGEVEVRLERVGAHLELSVHDTGEGIRPDFLPHVFDRFRQADGSSTRRHGGLGLGLSIVKQLVELHGGSVRASSAGEGRGASFVASLPLAPTRDEREESITIRRRVSALVPETAARGSAPQLGGVEVLIVDDEPDAREVVQRLLEACGAKVRAAASAAEALEALALARPSVLISDIGMPGTDGYQLIRQVRQLGADGARDVPAIALTAFARSDDRLRAIAAGYQMHLTKPVDASELITIVASLSGVLTPD